MRTKFLNELAGLGLSALPAQGPPVVAADLEPLPEPARRYLRFMNVLDRPRDTSFRARMTGRFRRSPTDSWMRCEAWQYNCRPNVTRVFHIRIRFGGLVPVLGRDTYAGGRGRMLIRLLDLVTVGDGQGEAYDIGEPVTWLNDGIMIAPSMLLVPEVRWSPVDSGSFDVALTDHGRTVGARVFVDDRGAPLDFSTTDRFYAPDPRHPVRTRWTTPVEGWREVEGRRVWTRGQAVWRLPEGPFAYADFELDPAALVFNVPPGP